MLFNSISARNDSSGNYQGMAAIGAEENQIGVQVAFYCPDLCHMTTLT